MRKLLLLLCLLGAGWEDVRAQSLDLDHLLHYKDKYIRVGGGVFFNSVYTYSDDPRVLQQPFVYMIGGNVNVQLATFSLPFSFSYTNQQFIYTHPFKFNRLSVHPKYKWVTAHIGDCALSFSPYSLNGVMFTGGGLEIAPPRTGLRLTALYGRFLKATEPDSFNIPAYARWGWGVKADFEKEKYKLGLSVFHAKDKVSSITAPADFRAVYPQENVVVDATLNATLAKWLVIDGEYAVSTLTRDLRYTDVASSQAGFLAPLMNGNSSTVSYHAYKGGITAILAKAQLRLGYERVDPDYTSLGAYYFTNDLENVTLALSRSFFKNKLSIALTGGAQRDDLNNAKVRASKRFVGSASVTYQASERLNLSGQYSTFQSYSNMRSQFDYINSASPLNPADTLNFAQVSRNASGNLAWTVKKSETALHLFTANVCWQDAADKEGDRVRAGGGSTLMNSALAYTIQYPKKGFGITAAVNGTYNTVGTANMYLFGPAAGINKSFAKPSIKTGLSVAYNNAFADGASTGDVWNLRGNAAYTFHKKHQLSLSITDQLRKVNSGLTPGKRSQLMIASFNYAFAL